MSVHSPTGDVHHTTMFVHSPNGNVTHHNLDAITSANLPINRNGAELLINRLELQVGGWQLEANYVGGGG